MIPICSILRYNPFNRNLRRLILISPIPSPLNKRKSNPLNKLPTTDMETKDLLILFGVKEIVHQRTERTQSTVVLLVEGIIIEMETAPIPFVSHTIRTQLHRIFQLIFKMTTGHRQALYMDQNINTLTGMLQ
eukprot:XP_011442231.2 PREDICTED: uncharacterized protein LOC105338703 [Crassostrea gigas]